MLDIPVFINGVRQVITVNTINSSSGILIGTGSGKNLFFNTSGLPSAIAGGSGDDLILSGVSNDTLSGGGGNDTYVFGLNFGQDTINNISATGTSASGRVSFGTGISDESLWFQKVGSDLEVDLLGTSNKITISNWYGPNASAQVASFNTASGLKLDGQIAQLVSAMASYGASNPAFNPHTTAQMPTDPTLQAAIAAAWHG